MKIVRLKRGYRINLNDSEYEALQYLAIQGEGDVEGMGTWDWAQLGPNLKRGLNRLLRSGSWAIAEDRR